MGTFNHHRVAGIDPKNVVDEYQDRALEELSDAEIFGCPIVARPPVRALTSFTLHAPLEVMARYGLMRLVDPSDRELTRLQMVASAAVYGHQVDLMPAPARVYSFPDVNTAAGELASAFRSADADGMEALVLSVALQFGTGSLVNLLTPLALPTLTGASHSHIGLWLLLRHAEPAGVEDASLLRSAARALAADPAGQMKSFQGMSIEGTRRLETPPEHVSKEILDKLANPAKGTLGGESIRELVEAGEKTGNVDTLFGDFIRHDLQPTADRCCLPGDAASQCPQHAAARPGTGQVWLVALPDFAAVGVRPVQRNSGSKIGARGGSGVDHRVSERPERSSLGPRLAPSAHPRCERPGSPPDISRGRLPRLVRGGRRTIPDSAHPGDGSLHTQRHSLGEVHSRLSRHGDLRSGARSTVSGGRCAPLRALDGRGAARDNRRSAPCRPHHSMKRGARAIHAGAARGSGHP